MKKRKVIITLLSIVFIAIILVLVFNLNKNYELYDVSEQEIEDSYKLLNNSLDETKAKNTYYDYIKNVNVNYTTASYNGVLLNGEPSTEYEYTKGDSKLLNYKESANYTVNVSKAGYYNIEVDYYILGTPLTNFNVTVSVNDKFQFDEAEHITVPILWEDETKDFPLDTYKDETLPRSIKKDVWTSLDVYDNKYSTDTPLLFYFNEGENSISIRLISSNGRLVLGDLKVKSPKKIENYSNYISGLSQQLKEDISLPINAISYTQKNSSYVRMASLNDPLAQPFSQSQKKLNIIDGKSWKTSGQEISYQIEVPKTGLYSLSLYYRNDKNEYSTFRSIYIDGEVPFSECLSYEFAETGSSYNLHTLQDKDGKDYQFFLSVGTHTITLKAETSPLFESITKLQKVVDHINQLALEVLKITGSDVDENRTWDITKYIPETESYLKSYDIVLKGIVNDLSQYSAKSCNSSSLAFIQRSIKLLQELIQYPGKLPLYLDRLYSGTSSINQLLGDVLTNISDQPMYLESMYFNANEAKSSNKTSNFFANIGNSISQLFQTFFSNKYQTTISDDMINVWVNRPITYIDQMQKMIDADFNVNSDVKVKLSAMPDQSKLTLSVAAGNAPDVVLGIQSHIPYDLAIRNGVYDLTNFEDFWEICDRFAPGTLLSFIVSDENGDRVYAIPESLDFNVLAYRSDIFNALDISTNLQTWDDVIGILPTLQRYGMNFYLPIAADNATKWFYQTSNMLLQAGGSLYSKDGLSVAINSKESVEGLDLLTRLFTEKSLPTAVPSFYAQFRNGTLPIGIMSFSNYLQMKNAAPEISGKWEISLPLGTKVADEEGNEYIDRTYISSGTSGAIMQTSNYKNESWEFLKWWTSTEIQSQFAYNLQSTYGPEYLWLSSNLDAVKDCQIDTEDKEVIVESFDWIVDVVRNPGQYMVERGLSNIWSTTVLNGEPLRVQINNQVIIMNREIVKKMEEFGYIDSSGKVLVEFYIKDIKWVEEQIRKAKDNS